MLHCKSPLSLCNPFVEVCHIHIYILWSMKGLMTLPWLLRGWLTPWGGKHEALQFEIYHLYFIKIRSLFSFIVFKISEKSSSKQKENNGALSWSLTLKMGKKILSSFIVMNHFSQKLELLGRGTWMILYLNIPPHARASFGLEAWTMHKPTLPCAEILHLFRKWGQTRIEFLTSWS